ncbi:TetR/AcrR family transcriptional regulator [Streptomyces sp. NPDC059373]
MNTRAGDAVRRALEGRQREAAEEVERILAAAVRVMERVAPQTPRISDIVAEAGTSNKAFYRYFGGKDDLVLAVMESGVGRLASYLEHQMAKEDTPAGRITRWIEGVMLQAADPGVASASRAALTQLSVAGDRWMVDPGMTAPLRELLMGPLTEVGSADPRRDGAAVFEVVFGTMRRHLAGGTRPEPGETEHLVRFCLNAVTPPQP